MNLMLFSMFALGRRSKLLDLVIRIVRRLFPLRASVRWKHLVCREESPSCHLLRPLLEILLHAIADVRLQRLCISSNVTFYVSISARFLDMAVLTIALAESKYFFLKLATPASAS